MTADLINVKRASAERSRRLARALTSNHDRVRLLAYADELDAQADALEKAAKEAAEISPPPVNQGQMQAQHGSNSFSEKKKP